ncbi:hypothetical protein QCN29_06205 [Streptomyces sp. HNM0663]|uniref:Uncharacterized protein n=1 Tax=Streptomyces chengmaiensis TaxID=3040919 RepID=A0ABT6HJE2_9ACTN|nr:hypothetical protein [Streptomyces chengmaiensis]MDH2388383.1 hypothetical protein [Streptomyces chengmaiensis]
MATKVDNEAWEKWPDEVLTEDDAEFWGRLELPPEGSGDHSGLPWDEWKKPGQSWVAFRDEDFTDACEFSAEIMRRAKADKICVDVIPWSWEVVFFQFLDGDRSGCVAFTDEDLQDLMDDAA